MAQQLSLSFELICFLEWLTKEGKLRHLVKEFVNKDMLQYINEDDMLELNDHLHAVVVNFVRNVEDTLMDEFEKSDAVQVLTKKSKDFVFEKDILELFLKNWKPSSNEPVN